MTSHKKGGCMKLDELENERWGHDCL